jgi:hypothetical protein
MKIAIYYRKEDSYTGEIIAAAIRRSFTASQIETRMYGEGTEIEPPEGTVLVNPGESERRLLADLLSGGRKVLLTGRLEGALAGDLGLRLGPLPEDAGEWGRLEPDPAEPFNLTETAIYYDLDHRLGQCSPLNPRHLVRFDFTDEWNNLGYGRISTTGDPWSLSHRAVPGEAEAVAWVEKEDGERLSAYAAVLDLPGASALWFNRAVGPVDSLEWRIVECFFGDYRPGELHCIPYLSEIPHGYEGAVTARLDCDQAVSSARELFELYRGHDIPLSLAVLTGLPMTPEDMRLLNDVAASGVSILSHSHSHMENWGGDYETALEEVRRSMQWIEENIPSASPARYTVSPFHQNPVYAVRAMADAGYRGFVGGIIHNDPEFLMGRAGRVPFVEPGVVSHSQQCMLHGDCYHRYRNSIDVYRESFENHLRAGAIFGYSDHPFSSEYQYGWLSEPERLEVHEELIRFLKSHQGLWWPSLGECMDFLVKRDRAGILVRDGRIELEGVLDDGLPPLSVHFKGERLTGDTA